MGAFSPLLYRIAHHLPPKERAKREIKVDGRHGNTKVSDETVKSIIRSYRRGVRVVDLMYEFGLKRSVIENWIGGSNRGHLLAEVEREDK